MMSFSVLSAQGCKQWCVDCYFSVAATVSHCIRMASLLACSTQHIWHEAGADAMDGWMLDTDSVTKRRTDE